MTVTNVSLHHYKIDYGLEDDCGWGKEDQFCSGPAGISQHQKKRCARRTVPVRDGNQNTERIVQKSLDDSRNASAIASGKREKEFVLVVNGQIGMIAMARPNMPARTR